MLHKHLVTKDKTTGKETGFIERVVSECTDARVGFVLLCNTARVDALGLLDKTSGCFVADDRGFLNSADDTILKDAAKVYASNNPRYPELEKVLRLNDRNTWGQMHRFDASGKHIVRHPDVASILKDYAAFRLPLYKDRLEYQVGAAGRELIVLQNKIRFVEEVLAGTMNPRAFVSVTEWWKALAAKGYKGDMDPVIVPPPLKTASDLPVVVDKDKDKSSRDVDDLEEDVHDGGEDDHSDMEVEEPLSHGAGDGGAGSAGSAGCVIMKPTFKYLTQMYMSSLTGGMLDRLKAAAAKVQADMEVLKAQTPTETWIRELAEFKTHYSTFMHRRKKTNTIEDALRKTKVMSRVGTGAKGKAKPGPAKRPATTKAKPSVAGAGSGTTTGGGGGGGAKQTTLGIKTVSGTAKTT